MSDGDRRSLRAIHAAPTRLLIVFTAVRRIDGPINRRHEGDARRGAGRPVPLRTISVVTASTRRAGARERPSSTSERS